MSTIQLYLKDFSAYLLKPRKATSTSLPITITSKKTNKTKLPKFSQRKIPQTLSFFLFLLSVSHYKRVSSNINKINNKETTTKKGRPFWVLERHNEESVIEKATTALDSSDASNNQVYLFVGIFTPENICRIFVP